MATYKTPGVYVEEISTLPPSVAEVSTAIPAFIGYTEKGPKIARINTLLEYEDLFGKAKPSSFSVETPGDADTGMGTVEINCGNNSSAKPEFLMYYCVSLYFKNGGGSCYILSIGNYKSNASPKKDDFLNGLNLLEKEDEPTLILLTDAVNLDDADYYDVCQAALKQCDKLGDRFVILDVKDGKKDVFRDKIGTNSLMYGAAYHPYLKTTLNYQYLETGVTIQGGQTPKPPAPSPERTWEKAFGDNGIVVSYTGGKGKVPQISIKKGNKKAANFILDATQRELKIEDIDDMNGKEVVDAWEKWKNQNPNSKGFDIKIKGNGQGSVDSTNGKALDMEEKSPEPVQEKAKGSASENLESIKSEKTALYNQIKAAMSEQRVTLPPSAAVAGVYARVDRERGVWKAPANVSLSSVIGPVSKITNEEQEGLNVDPTAGKSINAIREFIGKGTLVWGARTLAGNDNEWRYVSVRRLFIMIEESTKKATSFAVFEPNDATTWLKVKGMIESYLYGLWERGALAGPTPEAAYYVHVGLGKTMTAQDVLEGRMIVEIGVAAVRPAEFIIIRFMHKLQEA